MDNRVLMLGSGLVAGPAIDYLLAWGAPLTIATDDARRAEALVGGAAQGQTKIVELDAADVDALGQLIAEHALTISLLPAQMHTSVADLCIEQQRSLINASYISEEMRARDSRARQRNVLILGEVGLDPGIDHMSTMAVIDQAKARGETVLSFRSYCGGLPAPESNDNPWGYKFSWSPLGVLQASKNAARFMRDGEIVERPCEQVFSELEPLTVEGMTFEAYPNRDSLPYRSLYGLTSAETVLRATLRWPGWGESIDALRDLGLLSDRLAEADNWATVLERCAGRDLGSLRAQLAPAIVERLDFLGLLAAEPCVGLQGQRVIAALAARMAARLAFSPGQSDLVVMQHLFRIGDGKATRGLTSTLVARGDQRASAMARTVGLPVAIAARLVLEQAYHAVGVQLPLSPQLYRPLLAELNASGVALVEQETP